MNYPAQSGIWRLDMAKPKINGNTNNVGRSRVLARVQQIFPFTLFPDKLIVEELRIVWLRQLGPWTNEVISIMATDIASVNASSGPFFGHIHVQSLTGGPQILVESLLRGDVFRVRDLVEGVVLSARQGLHITNNNLEEERQSLIRAGHVN